MSAFGGSSSSGPAPIPSSAIASQVKQLTDVLSDASSASNAERAAAYASLSLLLFESGSAGGVAATASSSDKVTTTPPPATPDGYKAGSTLDTSV